jgi:hypothetical protein
VSRIPYHWKKLRDGRKWYRIEVREGMVDAMLDKLAFATGEWMVKIHSGRTKAQQPTRAAVFMIHDIEDWALVRLSFDLRNATVGRPMDWGNTLEPMKLYRK